MRLAIIKVLLELASVLSRGSQLRTVNLVVWPALANSVSLVDVARRIILLRISFLSSRFSISKAREPLMFEEIHDTKCGQNFVLFLG